MTNPGLMPKCSEPFPGEKSTQYTEPFRITIPAPLLKGPQEYTLKEVADKFGVTHHVVYYWIERGYVKARKITNASPWLIELSPEKEKELYIRVNNSAGTRNLKTESCCR